MSHLTSNNNLLNPFQSAYIKGYSTETTLLSVHDHIIKAMSLQQVTCLTLLDLSAAFDTIDHSYLNVNHHGLDSLQMLYLGYNPTCLIALSLLTSKVLNQDD